MAVPWFDSSLASCRRRTGIAEVRHPAVPDAIAMALHHGRHHARYVARLNATSSRSPSCHGNLGLDLPAHCVRPRIFALCASVHTWGAPWGLTLPHGAPPRSLKPVANSVLAAPPPRTYRDLLSGLGPVALAFGARSTS